MKRHRFIYSIEHMYCFFLSYAQSLLLTPHKTFEALFVAVLLFFSAAVYFVRVFFLLVHAHAAAVAVFQQEKYDTMKTTTTTTTTFGDGCNNHFLTPPISRTNSLKTVNIPLLFFTVTVDGTTTTMCFVAQKKRFFMIYLFDSWHIHSRCQRQEETQIYINASERDGYTE